MIITASGFKGGSARSVTTLLLAHLTKGVVWDMDKQGSATAGLRLPGTRGSSYLALEDFAPASNASTGAHGGLLIPSDEKMGRLVNEPGMMRMGDIIRPFADQHDYLLIDTQGSSDSVTIGAAMAADVVLIPMQLADSDLHSAAEWIRTLQKNEVPGRILILPSRVDTRLGDNQKRIDAVRSLGVEVMDVVVPQQKRYSRLITTRKLDEAMESTARGILEAING